MSGLWTLVPTVLPPQSLPTDGRGTHKWIQSVTETHCLWKQRQKVGETRPPAPPR